MKTSFCWRMRGSRTNFVADGAAVRLLMALPKPFAWLDEHVDQLSQPLMQQPWVETLENAAKLQVGAMNDALIAIRSLFDLPNAVMDRMEALNADAQLISALQGLEGEALRTAVANFSLPRLSPKRGLSAEEKEWGKRFSDGRTAIKKRAERANELLNPDLRSWNGNFRRFRCSCVGWRHWSNGRISISARRKTPGTAWTLGTWSSTRSTFGAAGSAGADAGGV